MRLAPDSSAPPASIERIAEAEGLGYEHAAKIMRLLRRGELVDSTRGAHGGYHLARPASEIAVWDALVALDNPLYDGAFCGAFAGQQPACSHATGACNLKVLWQHVGQTLEQGLSRIFLADLLEGRSPISPPMAPVPLASQQGAP
jgi:Rrf2 family cysteine metabolism transcriptional repressor